MVFGTIKVGAQSPGQTATIFDNGPADLHVVSIVLGGANPADFTLDLAGLAPVVPFGKSTSFNLACAPLVVGQRIAQVQIASNDPKLPIKIIQALCAGK
jgi:hypothetical protein